MSQTDKVPYFKSWQDPTAAAGCNDVGAALSAMNTIEYLDRTYQITIIPRFL
jgi:hypothetical protein